MAGVLHSYGRRVPIPGSSLTESGGEENILKTGKRGAAIAPTRHPPASPQTDA